MKTLPSGAAIEIFETLDSTSLEARRRARDASSRPRWFIALSQTAGYGRRGRAWAQRPGDFAGTLAFRPDAPAARFGQLSFIAALSVASALDEHVDPHLIAFKWPNDILIDGGKVAGLLLERIDDDQGPIVSIGIGINIVSAPADMPFRAARLVDHASAPPDPARLARRIDEHFWRYYGEWKRKGFERARRLWLERAQGVGEDIGVKLPNEELAGVFDGLDESGALILRSGAGKRIIAAGEVYFDPRDEKG